MVRYYVLFRLNINGKETKEETFVRCNSPKEIHKVLIRILQLKGIFLKFGDTIMLESIEEV